MLSHRPISNPVLFGPELSQEETEYAWRKVLGYIAESGHRGKIRSVLWPARARLTRVIQVVVIVTPVTYWSSSTPWSMGLIIDSSLWRYWLKIYADEEITCNAADIRPLDRTNKILSHQITKICSKANLLRQFVIYHGELSFKTT
jgi:hypothetical protein